MRSGKPLHCREIVSALRSGGRQASSTALHTYVVLGPRVPRFVGKGRDLQGYSVLRYCVERDLERGILQKGHIPRNASKAAQAASGEPEPVGHVCSAPPCLLDSAQARGQQDFTAQRLPDAPGELVSSGEWLHGGMDG